MLIVPLLTLRFSFKGTNLGPPHLHKHKQPNNEKQDKETDRPLLLISTSYRKQYKNLKKKKKSPTQDE